MKRIIPYPCLLLGCALFLMGCSQKNEAGRNQSEKVKLVIATAANMQFAMEALTQEFTATNGIECDLVISSSGKLTAQIKEGAPFDLFVAANMKYPEEVYNSGKAVAQPKVYAYGKLVLWSMVEELQASLKALKSESVKRIALANPRTAPYGEAAIEVLHHYQLFDQVESKLVYGESIAQTNQFVTTQSAEVGFTAMSTVLSPKMNGKGNWMAVDEQVYSPIKQGVVMIKRKKTKTAEVQQFFEFLFSEEAKTILEDFGYSIRITD